MIKIKTSTPEETFKVGERLGNKLNQGDIVCLQGDLGVGKTCFAKGICKGLKVKEDITSPTYTIINEYEGKYKVNHMDLYRIRREDELHEVGFEDYLYSDGVTIIEWPDKSGTLMPDNYLDINLRGQGNNREIRIIPQANKYIGLMAELKENEDTSNR